MYISANKLKELRKLSGFSQEELAEAADVSLATLQSWEQGKRVPHDIYMIKNLCNALQLPRFILLFLYRFVMMVNVCR